MSGAWKHPPRRSSDLPMNEIAISFIRFVVVIFAALLIIVAGVLGVSIIQKAQDQHIYDRINLSAPIGRG